MSIQFADTDDQRRAIHRLRYEIYVEEMNFFKEQADHEQRAFTDRHDSTGRLMYVMDGDQLAGTLRMHWGGDGPFSDEFEETYNLSRFESVVPRRDMLILTRFMLRPEYRGSSLACRLIAEAARFALEKGVKLAFCDCRPNLLNLYRRIGFRPYHQTCNDPGMGIMVPLVMQVEDTARLKRLRSPLLRVYGGRVESSSDERIESLIPAAPAQDVSLETARRWSRFLKLGRGNHGGALLSCLDESETLRLLKRGHVIDCRRGDRVFQQGGVDRTVFLILSGVVELRSGTCRETRRRGDLLGEEAFLLGGRYSSGAFALSRDVRVLSLDEASLRRSNVAPPAVGRQPRDARQAA